MVVEEEFVFIIVEYIYLDVFIDGKDVLEEIMIFEVESFRVNDQQFEEVIVLLEGDREVIGIKFVSEEDDGVGLGERIEKLLFEFQEDGKDGVVDYFEDQNAVLEDVEVLGGLIREFSDVNGLKLKEKEVGREGEFQEGKVYSDLEKESKI